MRSLPLLVAALLFSSPALAAEWSVIPEKSHVTFTASQGDETFSGAFGDLSAQIDFDPAAPGKGSIKATIALKGVTVEGKDRQEAITGADWFDVAQFPEATFTSSTITPAAEANQYIAKGTLTIKGIAQPATLPFSLTVSGNDATAHGTLALKRNAFKVGTGDFASDEWIGYDVNVDIHIVATSNAKAS